MSFKALLATLKPYSALTQSGIKPPIIYNNVLPQVTQSRGKTRLTKFKYIPLEHGTPFLPADFDPALTEENESYIQNLAQSKSLSPGQSSPLIQSEFTPGTWSPGTVRTGTVARKIGSYPMWNKNGVKFICYLLHIEDNHVLRYIPPEELIMSDRYRKKWWPNEEARQAVKLGSLLVGAGTLNPQLVTDKYLKLFEQAGVMPKARLMSFLITPNSYIPPGQALGVTHYRVGDYLDITSRTIDHGFQGVMKRWGFKGMPATHGVTKSHRRGGSLQCGNKHNIWRGKKMPGQMGDRWITVRSHRIVRINYEHNVLYVKGPPIPGDVNAWMMVKDSVCHLFTEEHPPPAFPCDLEFGLNPPEVEEEFDEDIHPFHEPSITPHTSLLIRKKKMKKKN